ncbi:hypothetical protein Slin14017_G036440 [Septoria linicola]|nr:hypothetical protein Slin14017_G036440 [Septoria linicola]
MYAFDHAILPSGQTVPQSPIKILDDFMYGVDAMVNESSSAAEDFRRIFTPEAV